MHPIVYYQKNKNVCETSIFLMGFLPFMKN